MPAPKPIAKAMKAMKAIKAMKAMKAKKKRLAKGRWVAFDNAKKAPISIYH